MSCAGGASRSLAEFAENPKKIVKSACNFPKVVYSIGVAERERVAPPAENR